jgi:hypothetical protein
MTGNRGENTEARPSGCLMLPWFSVAIPESGAIIARTSSQKFVCLRCEDRKPSELDDPDLDLAIR